MPKKISYWQSPQILYGPLPKSEYILMEYWIPRELETKFHEMVNKFLIENSTL